jgi:hypothetical protein
MIDREFLKSHGLMNEQIDLIESFCVVEENDGTFPSDDERQRRSDSSESVSILAQCIRDVARLVNTAGQEHIWLPVARHILDHIEAVARAIHKLQTTVQEHSKSGAADERTEQ